MPRGRERLEMEIERFSVLEVDDVSRTAHVQAGVLGPALEDQLGAHGFTLRHFPQSFERSTLGGWIATRAGGHFATLYTHIDDLVQAIRAVTPRGGERRPGALVGSPSRDSPSPCMRTYVRIHSDV